MTPGGSDSGLGGGGGGASKPGGGGGGGASKPGGGGGGGTLSSEDNSVDSLVLEIIASICSLVSSSWGSIGGDSGCFCSVDSSSSASSSNPGGGGGGGGIGKPGGSGGGCSDMTLPPLKAYRDVAAVGITVACGKSNQLVRNPSRPDAFGLHNEHYGWNLAPSIIRSWNRRCW